MIEYFCSYHWIALFNFLFFNQLLTIHRYHMSQMKREQAKLKREMQGLKLEYQKKSTQANKRQGASRLPRVNSIFHTLYFTNKWLLFKASTHVRFLSLPNRGHQRQFWDDNKLDPFFCISVGSSKVFEIPQLLLFLVGLNRVNTSALKV